MLLSWFQIRDPDAFWHLKVGEVMLERGEILRTNTLSSLYSSYPWANPEWLFEVILASVYKFGGFPAVAAFKAVTVALVVAALYFLNRSVAASRLVSVLLVLLVLGAIRHRLTERPHLFSFAFFAVSALLAEHCRRTTSRTVLVVSALMYVVWSNIHPGLVFGLMYLYALAIAECVFREPGTKGWPAGSRRLLAMACACTLASLCNRLGVGILTYGPKHHVYHQLVGIREFSPATFLSDPVFFLTGAFAAGAAIVSWKLVDRALLVVGGLFFVLAATYQRNVPEFTIVAATILAGVLPGKIRWGEGLRGRGGVLSVLCGLLAAFSLVWSLAWDRNYPFRWGVGPREDLLPAGAADFMLRESLPENLYNQFGLGGYLAFRLYPRYRVFQDGRIPAYPIEFLSALQSGHRDLNFREFFKARNVNTALVEIANLGMFSETEWAVVYWDSKHAVVVRRSAVSPALRERLEYRYYRPGVSLHAPGSEAVALRMEHEMRRNARDRRFPFYGPHFDLAHLMLIVGRKNEASHALDRAERTGPDFVEAWLEIAKEWLLLSQPVRARAAAEAGLELDPRNSELLSILAQTAAGSS